MRESNEDVMDKSIPLIDKIVYRLYKSVGNTFEMPLRMLCPDFHRDLIHVKESLLDARIQWRLLMPIDAATTAVRLDVNMI